MHGDVQYCVNADGEEVEVPIDEHHEGEHDHAEGEDEHDHSGENCHFHAGVEHCGSDEDSSFDPAVDCVVPNRRYNKRLRIGAIFIVLVTSAIAVFGPVFLSRFSKIKLTGLVFTIIKQFGTGVIIATALIHLITHANLLFGNPCVGELKYEATSTAIVMAGAFSAFIVEYIADRILQTRANKQKSDGSAEGVVPAVRDKEVPGSGNGSLGELPGSQNGSTSAQAGQVYHSHSGHGHSHGPLLHDKLAVLVMEGGIIFHSILIGLTLVVAGDSVFATLLVVIVFHQMFEGLALGVRISLLPNSVISYVSKLLMAFAFAVITPIGMAIGVGVLNRFNGNDRSTLIAMATLDSFSAGILLWVGLVEMWAVDWVFGELRTSGPVKTMAAMLSLIAGMILMGLLGRWA
ncbi:ZIP zinc transporter-domain-containing protein [Kalaharituber pfeilii]|nr:ZIP zinc transporter-domain-containing protein [Kalaharituber pfeilii]